MKAIVHIGAPKAGSSSIQEFLFRNIDGLAKKGFRFHRNVEGRGSQWEYPMAVLADLGRMLPGEMERIRYHARTLEEQGATARPHAEALAGYAQRWREPVALFSSEHILPWMNKTEGIEAFDALFRSAFSEVRYIVYFRPHDDSLLSGYSERIKRGYTYTIDEFIEKRRKTLGLFRPAKRWRDVVGKDRLAVRMLDADYLKNGDLIDDYCDACGIDPAGLERPPRINESLTAPGAECLRALNRRIPEVHPDGGFNPLRETLLQAVAELSAEGPKLRLTADQQERVDAITAKSNERFRKAFFPERKTLFRPKKNKDRALTEAEIKDMALAVMTDLVIRIRLSEIPDLTEEKKKRSYTLPA